MLIMAVFMVVAALTIVEVRRPNNSKGDDKETNGTEETVFLIVSCTVNGTNDGDVACGRVIPA